MTRAGPAEPVNEVRKERRSSQAATYSDRWASSLGTTYASRLCLTISSRRADTRADADIAEMSLGSAPSDAPFSLVRFMVAVGGNDVVVDRTSQERGRGGVENLPR